MDHYPLPLAHRGKNIVTSVFMDNVNKLLHQLYNELNLTFPSFHFIAISRSDDGETTKSLHRRAFEPSRSSEVRTDDLSRQRTSLQKHCPLVGVSFGAVGER